jgi:hypothetical protein
MMIYVLHISSHKICPNGNVRADVDADVDAEVEADEQVV